MGDILAGDQQLGYGVVIFSKELVVDVHEFALPYGCRCLLAWDVFGTASEPQLPHAHADGTGGDQNHLMSRIFDIADDLTQLCHPPDVQVPAGVGQGGGAHLDDDTHTFASRIKIETLYSILWMK